MSQAELAQKSGFQPSAISHFESGRRSPSFNNLKKLADTLAVTIDYLLGREAVPASAGPVAQNLLRNFEQMSAEDQDDLANFAALLAEKNRRRQGDLECDTSWGCQDNPQTGTIGDLVTHLNRLTDLVWSAKDLSNNLISDSKSMHNEFNQKQTKPANPYKEFCESIDKLPKQERIELIDDAIHQLQFERRWQLLTPKQIKHMCDETLNKTEIETLIHAKPKKSETLKLKNTPAPDISEDVLGSLI